LPRPISANNASLESFHAFHPQPPAGQADPRLTFFCAIRSSKSCSTAGGSMLTSPSVSRMTRLLPPRMNCCCATSYASLTPVKPGEGPSALTPSTSQNAHLLRTRHPGKQHRTCRPNSTTETYRYPEDCPPAAGYPILSGAAYWAYPSTRSIDQQHQITRRPAPDIHLPRTDPDRHQPVRRIPGTGYNLRTAMKNILPPRLLIGEIEIIQHLLDLHRICRHRRPHIQETAGSYCRIPARSPLRTTSSPPEEQKDSRPGC
jgi:hypothetical protein